MNPSRVPTFDGLMWPTIEALRETGGSASNEELLSKIIQREAISDEVASLVHTDGRQSRLGYNLAWAKTYLKKAGLLTNSQRGVWSLTEAGEATSRAQVADVTADVRRAEYGRKDDVAVELPVTPQPEHPSKTMATASSQRGVINCYEPCKRFVRTPLSDWRSACFEKQASPKSKSPGGRGTAGSTASAFCGSTS